MALTAEKFLKIQAADRKKLAAGIAPTGVQTCADCKVPLQESVTGNRPLQRGKRLVHLCSDCYFIEMGKELDKRPIFMPRARRG